MRNEPIAAELSRRLEQIGDRYQLTVSVPEITPELQHALRLSGVPWQRMESAHPAWRSVLAGIGAADPADFGDCPALPADDEGYGVQPNRAGGLVLASRTGHGLANGLYDLRRKLLSNGQAAESAAALLPAGPSVPGLRQRDTYQFLSPWHLPHLSADALTIEEWKTHLERMRALNANRWYFDFWADQYYHPDYPETECNRSHFEKMKAIADYAHELGLRTGVYLFPAQIPVEVYLERSVHQAVEASNYHGINGCPTNAWEKVILFDVFVLEYFGASLDDIVVELQDPGSCLCPQCCRDFPELVLRFIATYRQVGGHPADRRIDLCTLHFRDWLEEPGDEATGVSFAIPNLRARVFEMLPEGTTLMDIDNPTLDMGAGMKLRRNYFFFDLDPESGLESQQVFPRVKLRRIARQVQDSVRRGHDGVTAYRMMPFCQYVADYVLFRQLWDPSGAIDSVLVDLAAEFGIEETARPKFVQAICDLDAWWEDSDLAALVRADVALTALLPRGRVETALQDLADTVAVLALLGQYFVAHREAIRRADFYPPADWVQAVRRRMLRARIFQAYTVHQHWVVRSEEIVGQRIRWWLRGFDGELRPPVATQVEGANDERT